jgi:hypothetical protein
MTRNRSRDLQRTSNQQPAKQDADQKVEPVAPEIMVPSGGNIPLINAEIVQILIQNNNPDEIERLMNADLDYNKRRLEIVREHASEHPDAIENRITRRSRRTQYTILLVLGCFLLVVMPIVPLAVAAIFGTIVTLIVCGILVNARERELDLHGFIKLINIVVGKQKQK